MMFTGEILRKLRTVKGIKQSALAKKLGISQQAYSKLEQSKQLTRERTEHILQLMQCSIDDIDKLKAFAL